MDRTYRLCFLVLICLSLVLGWQEYLIDYDWDAAAYVGAVRDGDWFVPLGYGRVGYFFLLRPVRWIMTGLTGPATVASYYGFLRLIHLAFSVGLIGCWCGLSRRFVSARTMVIGAPLLLLNVPFLTYTSRIWTEMPMLLLVYAALWVWVAWVWQGRRRSCRVAGYSVAAVAMVAAILVREIAVFYLPAFVLPLLFERTRRREAILSAAVFAGVAALAWLVFHLLRSASKEYDAAVTYIESLFPVSFESGALGARIHLLAQTLWRQYLLAAVLFVAGVLWLLLRRQWALAVLLLCLTVLAMVWIVTRGDYYERYVMPIAPGLALGCLPLLERMQERRQPVRQGAVFGVLTLGLLLTMDWQTVQGCKWRSRMARSTSNSWMALALESDPRTYWLVGSLTKVLELRFKDSGVERRNALIWPDWHGKYSKVRPLLSEAIRQKEPVYVWMRRDAYNDAQWAYVQSLRGEYDFDVCSSTTQLCSLQPHRPAEEAVRIDFATETGRAALVEGFDPPEYWVGGATTVAWAHHSRAQIVLPPGNLPAVGKGDQGVAARIEFYMPDLAHKPPLEVALGARSGEYASTTTLTLEPGRQTFVLEVPRRPAASDPLQLTLSFRYVWNLREEFPQFGVSRQVTAAVCGLDLEPY